MKNPKPKSMSMKTTTPGSGPGLARQTPIKSGPTVQQPFASGHRIAKGKPAPSPKGSKNVGKHGRGSKMAQGGENESASGMSRTNLGRQRL